MIKRINCNNAVCILATTVLYIFIFLYICECDLFQPNIIIFQLWNKQIHNIKYKTTKKLKEQMRKANLKKTLKYSGKYRGNVTCRSHRALRLFSYNQLKWICRWLRSSLRPRNAPPASSSRLSASPPNLRETSSNKSAEEEPRKKNSESLQKN